MIKFRLNTISATVKHIILFVLFIGFFILQGCSSSPEEIGVGMDVKLSENNLTFSSEGGKKEIYTNKSFLSFMSREQKPGFSSLTTEWMNVKRTSDKIIEMDVLKNDTNKERVDTFYVFNGNWFGKVIVKQEYSKE